MKKILSIFIFAMLVFLVSCGSNSTISSTINSTYETITASEAKSMMDNNSSIILVDVREQSEYDTEHIQGAILLPLGTIEDDAETILPDKGAIYIIYCRSGNRSNQAAIELVDLGYTTIYDMGGIIDWDYETVT
ncbi:MAG: rhodanese-like domain-containing protein [Tenericutes bacterium]|nr:rhodanese-like domain-containing protein [Mycoplasmatota bacterium]